MARVICLAAVLWAIPASASTFTVTTTADSGSGSLRDAITQANAASGADTITFALTGTPPYTITLASALPAISSPVTIDGTSQAGYAGKPLIMIDGGNTIGTALVLATASTNSTVRGLAIGHTTLAAIWVGSFNATITANYLGTDTTGIVVARNQVGVYLRQLSAVEAPSATIDHNVIAGNTAYGIDVENGVNGVTVSNNYLGIGGDGATPLANQTAGVYTNGGANITIDNNVIAESQEGILISQCPGASITNNVIGADASGMPLPVAKGIDVQYPATVVSGNSISDASGAGIVLEGGNGTAQNNTLVGNHIGIELLSGGNAIRSNVITGNDEGVYGATSGLENLIDDNSIHDNGDPGLSGSLYPDVAVLASATLSNGTLAVAGSLTSAASTSYRVQFFDNPACDPSGAGEGQTYLGQTTVMTDAMMMAPIAMTVGGVAEGDAITATVTNLTQSSTSAFSTCVKACPVIAVAPSSFAVTVATPVSDMVTATGGMAGYTYAMTAGALPAGLSLASDGTLSGTPTSDASATFTITATDSKGCTGIAMYTVVPGCPAIAITPATLPGAMAGVAYSQQITAGSGDTFTATGLPVWLTLASDGTLSGTPSGAETDTFTVTATESSGCTAMASYTLMVAASPGADAGVDAAPAPADAGPDGGMPAEMGGGGGCGCRTGEGGPGGALVVAVLCLVAVIRRRMRA